MAAAITEGIQLRDAVVAVLVGENPQLRGRASGLLSRGGFRMLPLPDDAEVLPEAVSSTLIVLLGRRAEAARLREIRELHERHPDCPILAVMPDGASNASLRRALLAGALGIVREEDCGRALAPTARAVLAGQLTVPVSLGRNVAPQPLSHREKQILSLVAQGQTNREIAHSLFLAESTVKTHLSSAFRKVDARSRAEAIARIQDPETGYGMQILRLDG